MRLRGQTTHLDLHLVSHRDVVELLRILLEVNVGLLLVLVGKWLVVYFLIVLIWDTLYINSLILKMVRHVLVVV